MTKRSAVIVIDLLKGLFKKNPTLPDPLDEKALFKTVRRVIDAGRSDGVNIVFIKETPKCLKMRRYVRRYRTLILDLARRERDRQSPRIKAGDRRGPGRRRGEG